MTKHQLKLLEDNGWEVECESPFEIRSKEGSFATGEAADIVLQYLKSESAFEEDNDSENKLMTKQDVFEYIRDNLSVQLSNVGNRVRIDLFIKDSSTGIKEPIDNDWYELD